jgi:hypothetical protein
VDPSSKDVAPPPCVNGYRDATPEESQQVLDAAHEYVGFGYPSEGMTQAQLSHTIDCSHLVAAAIRNSVNPTYKYSPTASIPRNPGLRELNGEGEHQAGDIELFPGHVGFYDPTASGGRDFLSATGYQGGSIAQNAGKGVRNVASRNFGSNQRWFRATVPCK